MSPQPTPGPWAATWYETNQRTKLGYWGFVSRLGQPDQRNVRLDGCTLTSREPAANARLIAASPRLLAAAIAVRATCPADPDINPAWNAAWNSLIAAIAATEPAEAGR